MQVQSPWLITGTNLVVRTTAHIQALRNVSDRLQSTTEGSQKTKAHEERNAELCSPRHLKFENHTDGEYSEDQVVES